MRLEPPFPAGAGQGSSQALNYPCANNVLGTLWALGLGLPQRRPSPPAPQPVTGPTTDPSLVLELLTGAPVLLE